MNRYDGTIGIFEGMYEEEVNKKVNYNFFNSVILDVDSTISGETRIVVADIGCNGKKHAVEITEQFYSGNEITFAKFITDFEIGACTCGKDKREAISKGTMGGFILTKDM